MRLLGELRGPHIGNPDLNRPKPLFAKALAMSADTNSGRRRRLPASHAHNVTCNDDETGGRGAFHRLAKRFCCAAGGLESESSSQPRLGGQAYQGTTETAILPDDASPPGRSMVIVRLGGNDSGDSDRVRITFATTELSCRDGGEVTPGTVVVGSEIEFIRVGNDAGATDPPMVGARHVQVSC